MPIFYLKGLKVTQFDKYAKLINTLSTDPQNIDSVYPGAKLERLTSHIDIDLYSVRFNHWARLIYTIIKDGPHKGHIVLCGAADDHNYDAVLLRLKKQKGNLRVFLPYLDDRADDLTDDEATTAAAPVDADPEEYAEMHFYGEHCIELNTSQIEVLQTSLPAIIHGAPGTGKTLIGANLAKNYLQNPSMKQDQTAPLRALFLFPTPKLADDTQKAYLDSCEFDGIARDDAGLVEFSTYEAFFKHRTPEGQLVQAGTSTGFDDFKDWYQHLPQNKKSELKRVKLDAEDCWAAFRICSLYSDVKRYEALSETQCAVPQNLRNTVHKLYSNYKEACEKGHNYSVWTHPFSCEEQFGLVVLDESHNQSGCTISSAYNLSQNGQFVALVGDHQKIGAHQSQLGGGCPAADLLAILVYEDSAQQGRQIEFKTHMLNQTHRNSETVVDVVNFFVDLKLRLGLSTATKGADRHLNGHNGELGRSQLIIAENDKPQLSALRKEYEGRPDVAILVPASRLTEARICWPQNLVFSALDAMGLEFPYVICDGLLNDRQGSMEVGKLLEKHSTTKAATAGHRGKQAADSDVLEQESWFNSLITACSRAQKAVFFVEDKIPPHTAGRLFVALDEVCHQRVKKTEAQAQQAAPVSTEAWLAQALTLLKENTPGMDAEAKRVMDMNLDHACDAYQQFLAQYTKNQQQRAESAPKTPPQLNLSAMTTKATPIPAKPAPKVARAAEARVASPTAQKGSQPVAQSTSKTKDLPKAASVVKAAKRTQESIYSDILFMEFDKKTLLKALDACNLDTLFSLPLASGTKETLLTTCFNSEKNMKMFAQCCIEKPELLSKVLSGELEKKARKVVGKKINLLFQGLSSVNAIHEKKPSPDCWPAHSAAEAGDLAALKFLFSIGVDLNAVNKNEITPAQIAAKYGQAEVLTYLEGVGVNLNQTDNKGFTLAHTAAANGQVDVLDLSSIRVHLNTANKYGSTPAHSAATNGQVNVLKYLRKADVDLNTANKDGFTPAHTAAANGKVNVLEYLSNIVRVDLNTANSNEVTIAHIAATNGHENVLTYLDGAHVNLNTTNKDGLTAVGLAAKHGRVNSLTCLRKLGVDLNQTDKNGLTLAHIAAANGKENVLRYLDSVHVNLNQTDNKGFTPAHSAAANGKVDVLKYLSSIPGVDLNAAQKDGFTLAHTAAANGKVNVLEYLSSIPGANLNAATTAGYTPAHSAAVNGQVDVLTYLHSIPGVNLNLTDNIGFTPIHSAAKYGRINVMKYLHNIVHVDLNQFNKNGYTPAQSAALNGQTHVLQYLQEDGYNINRIQPGSPTPLFLAAQNSRLLTLQYLLKLNLESSQALYISTADKLNAFASTVFASTGNVDVQERMRQKITERQSAGDTLTSIQLSPLDIAEVMGHQDAVATLREHAALKVSAAALVAPNGSIFNSGSHQAPAVVDELTKGATFTIK